ncbi:proto-oncogene Mas-like [Pleurodeles waltl]|uniref:proto-oncogene Mas-like n=1 Tax=Pleurodeles waltl TaxID=8319 RepID=UPI003709A621
MAEIFLTPFQDKELLANETEGNYSSVHGYVEYDLLYWINFFVSFLGCIENGLVIWLLGFHIKRNPFSVYILNLAIADFSFLLCVFCLSIFHIVEHDNDITGADIIIEVTELIMEFGYNTGLYLLTAISLERCLAVLCPIWYKCRRSGHQSTIVCVLIWVLAFLITPMECLMDLVCPIVVLSSSLFHCLFFVPLMVMSSVVLLVKVNKTAVRSPSSQLYLVVVTSVFIFLFFAMPVRVYYIFEMIFRPGEPYHLYHATILLSTINSSINPLIYLLVGSRKEKKFRESIKVVLRRALDDDAGSDHQVIDNPNPLNTTTS